LRVRSASLPEAKSLSEAQRMDRRRPKSEERAMWQEFRDFAMRGNALDLAIGVIIGAAFGKIVDGLVNDIIMPIIGIAGKADFSNYFIPLSSAVTATNLADAKKQGGVFAYGDFITILINFLIVAAALFAVIKGINMLNKKPAPTRAAPPPPSEEVVLLTQIRDALVQR
jgi:large conductance mechanosensitive channel